MSEAVRLQKILADAGIASRREAEAIIAEGSVTVNGKVAKLGDKAIPGQDHIKVNGKLMQKPVHTVVVALYKPRGILTVAPIAEKADQIVRVQTVLNLIPRIKEKVRPIGRLDTDAEGILLLTNDGDLGQRLNKQSYEIEKKYTVKVDGHIDANRLRRLSHGVEVEGKKTKPAKVEVTRQLEGKEWVEITTTDTRNRIIRKMFEAVGRPVDKVRRESFAGITLKDLVREQYRYLTAAEVAKLRQLVGLK